MSASYEVRLTEHKAGRQTFSWGMDFDTRRDAFRWVSSITSDDKCLEGLVALDLEIRPVKLSS